MESIDKKVTSSNSALDQVNSNSELSREGGRSNMRCECDFLRKEETVDVCLDPALQQYYEPLYGYCLPGVFRFPAVKYPIERPHCRRPVLTASARLHHLIQFEKIPDALGSYAGDIL